MGHPAPGLRGANSDLAHPPAIGILSPESPDRGASAARAAGGRSGAGGAFPGTAGAGDAAEAADAGGAGDARRAYLAGQRARADACARAGGDPVRQERGDRRRGHPVPAWIARLSGCDLLCQGSARFVPVFHMAPPPIWRGYVGQNKEVTANLRKTKNLLVNHSKQRDNSVALRNVGVSDGICRPENAMGDDARCGPTLLPSGVRACAGVCASRRSSHFVLRPRLAGTLKPHPGRALRPLKTT